MPHQIIKHNKFCLNKYLLIEKTKCKKKKPFGKFLNCHSVERAKFRGSHVIVGLVGLVSFYYCAFVGISWVQNIFSWEFRGS